MRAPKITHATFVDGAEVNSLSVEDLIHKIRSLEAENISLGEMTTESKAVKNQIALNTKAAADLASLLDKRPVTKNGN